MAGCLLLLGGSARAGVQAPAGVSSASTVAELRDELAQFLAQSKFEAAAWGIQIVSLETGSVWFEHNAQKLLKPASNAKLYTGALALHRLGPDYRIRTSIYAKTRPDAAGRLPGDLVVYGRGDPSIAARFYKGEYDQPWVALAQKVKAAGVKRIEGDLIGDESFFRGAPTGSGWTADDLQHYYGAEWSALTAQDNVVDLILKPHEQTGKPCLIETQPSAFFLNFINRTTTIERGTAGEISLYRPLGENRVYAWGQLPVGGEPQVDAVAVHDPALFFVTLFREALAREGIVVSGGLRTRNWIDEQQEPLDYSRWVELGYRESPALSDIAAMMMKPSQNLYAQLLWLQAGVEQPGGGVEQKDQERPSSPQASSEEAGREQMRAFLLEAGIEPDEVLLEEGSGLSRTSLVTANATVRLLQFMHQHPAAASFRDSLPSAGVDGTLRNRLKGTRAEKNVRAKTGTLRYVSALSGYLLAASEEPLAFSILLNNYSHPGRLGREEIDEFVLKLLELGRSPAGPKSPDAP